MLRCDPELPYDDKGNALNSASLYHLYPDQEEKVNYFTCMSDLDPMYEYAGSMEIPTPDNMDGENFGYFDGIIMLETDQSMDQSAKATLEKQREAQRPYNGGYNNCADYVTSGVEAAYGGSLDLDDEEVVRYLLQNVSVSTVNEQFNSLRTVDEATVLKDPGELKSVYETMTGKKNPEPVEPMEVPSGIITDALLHTGGY